MKFAQELGTLDGQALEARGLRGATDAAVLSVLTRLASMRDEPRRALLLARGAIDAAMRNVATRKWVTLLTGAVDVFAPGAGGADADAIRLTSAQVHTDVAEGRMEWARPRAFDALIGIAFSDLAGVLADPRGTVDEAEAFRAMVAEQRRAADQAKAAKEAAMQAQEDERRRAASRERQLLELRERYQWRQVGTANIRKPDEAKRIVKNLFPFEDPAGQNALIDAAWQARGAGEPIAEFLLDRTSDFSMSIDTAMVVLKAAWLAT